VLLIEVISSTATMGYAVLLIKYSKSRRTKGLPIAKKGQQPDLDNLMFHVRVLIPCYKENVDLVKLTVLGALKAPLPRNTLRTVYLCDDGKVRLSVYGAAAGGLHMQRGVERGGTALLKRRQPQQQQQQQGKSLQLPNQPPKHNTPTADRTPPRRP